MKLLILAAGKGERLQPLTSDHPKCMVKVCGRPLIEWQIQTAREIGIRKIAVVTGYHADAIRVPDIHYFHNHNFDHTNMVTSLWCASPWIDSDLVISYGDILYTPDVLHCLLRSTHAISVVIDQQWRIYWEARFDDILSDAESLQVNTAGCITNIGQQITDLTTVHGQYIGLMMFRKASTDVLMESLKMAQHAHPTTMPFHQMAMTDLLQRIIDCGHAVHSVPINRGWFEIDSIRDLEIANRQWPLAQTTEGD